MRSFISPRTRLPTLPALDDFLPVPPALLHFMVSVFAYLSKKVLVSIANTLMADVRRQDPGEACCSIPKQ